MLSKEPILSILIGIIGFGSKTIILFSKKTLFSFKSLPVILTVHSPKGSIKEVWYDSKNAPYHLN